MNNLPIVVQEGGANPPVIPDSLLSQYNALAEQMTSGFQGAFNRIKVGKMDFSLVEGGVSRKVDNGQVIGVCLGLGANDFCSWYEKTYEPTQEPEAPDLVWNWPDRSKFPDALPAQWRQKKNRQNQDRWDFRIARRSVWALLQPHPSTGQFLLNIESPYVFDITSASLYGNSDTGMNWYKWAGLIQMCNRYSQPPNFICSPAMFLTRLRIDPASTVSGVVYFEPLMTKEGTPAYLDSASFAQVVEAMQSQTVRDMLQVREILEWPKNTTSSGAAQQKQPVQSAASAINVSSPMAVKNPASGGESSMTTASQPRSPQSVQDSAAPRTAQSSPEKTVPMQSATASRLEQADAIINQAPAQSANSAAAFVAKQDAAKPAGASSNDDVSDAIRAFSDFLV